MRMPCLTLWWLLACDASAPAPDGAAPVPPPSEEEDEALAFIERYRRGGEVRRTSEPTVVFVEPQKDDCDPLPEQRPEDFEIVHWRRGADPTDRTPSLGLSERVCHFEWSAFHLDPPPGSCATPTAAHH